MFASLRRRQEELRSDSEETDRRWSEADFTTTAGLSLEDDWIRRIDVGPWPLAAVGSASGRIRVADLSTQRVVADSGDEQHAARGGDPGLLHSLHGAYDGGGVLAVAMHDDVVVSAGREGNVKVWRYHEDGNDNDNNDQQQLRAQGGPLDGVFVSSLSFDAQGALWVGGYNDKTVRRLELDTHNEYGAIKITVPLTVQFSSPVLSVATDTDLDLCVCGLEDGTVQLVRMTSGDVLPDSWRPFGDDDDDTTVARSVAVVRQDDGDEGSVVCGGGDGSLHLQRLSVHERTGKVVGLDCAVGAEKITPSHGGPVVSMAARRGGLLVTGAHDGSLRVWDCNTTPRSDGTGSRSLYHLVGYKVWLGSVCIDEEGLRLLSDGCDNSILVHDFSAQTAQDEQYD